MTVIQVHLRLGERPEMVGSHGSEELSPHVTSLIGASLGSSCLRYRTKGPVNKNDDRAIPAVFGGSKQDRNDSIQWSQSGRQYFGA